MQIGELRKIIAAIREQVDTAGRDSDVSRALYPVAVAVADAHAGCTRMPGTSHTQVLTLAGFPNKEN